MGVVRGKVYSKAVSLRSYERRPSEATTNIYIYIYIAFTVFFPLTLVGESSMRTTEWRKGEGGNYVCLLPYPFFQQTSGKWLVPRFQFTRFRGKKRWRHLHPRYGGALVHGNNWITGWMQAYAEVQTELISKQYTRIKVHICKPSLFFCCYISSQ
jgi:hypothetical protein